MIHRLAAAILAAIALATPAGAGPQAARGVVVESVAKGFEGERAGLRGGDVLLSWSRPAEPSGRGPVRSAPFRSPFDVNEAYIEQAPPAGSLTLVVLRDGNTRKVSISQYPWRIDTRPAFAGAPLRKWQESKRRLDAGELDAGLSGCRSLAAELSSRGNRLDAAWVWRRAAQAEAAAGRVEAASASFDRAAEEAGRAGSADAEAQIWGERGDFLWGLPRPAEAQKAMRQALAIRERQSSDSLATAQALHDLARVTEYLDPEFESTSRRALSIRERLAPGSAAEAASIGNLSIVSGERGDFRVAEDLQRRALAIHERLDTSGRSVALGLSRLCAIQLNTGDLSSAEASCEQSLRIWRRVGPDEPGAAIALHNSATVARKRYDFTVAADRFQQALAIREKTAPGSRGVGWNLFELGVVEMRRGNLDAAEAYFRRSREIQKTALPPRSPFPGMLDARLAELAELRGDLPGAAVLLRSAIDFFQKLTPDGAWVTFAANDLGRVLSRMGDLAGAEAQLRRVLEIRRRYAPASRETAESSHALGMLLWSSGRIGEAETELRRAVEDLEAQISRLGGSDEARSVFAAEFADYYRDYVRLLLETRREQDAFYLLERYRAGSFLRTLAQRDLGAPAEVPAELERERRAVNAEYERLQGELIDLSPASDAKRVEESLVRLTQLRARQTEIADAIRKASPRYGELRYPRPLDLSGSRAALDPGTILLSYSVGRDRTQLFAVRSGPGPGSDLAVFTLAIGEKELRESVDAFRRLIARGVDPELARSGRALYDTLLAPAEDLVSRSERILIIPDGPLYRLPWSALSRPQRGGGTRYVAEWKPVFTAPSATVFAELKRARGDGSRVASVVLAAFGDPAYPARVRRDASASRGSSDSPDAAGTAAVCAGDDDDAFADAAVRSVARGGFSFERLPASRGEVEAIAALYSPRAAKYLGADATEEQAKAVGRDVPLVHFACHALLNGRFPLDSALVLSIPENPAAGRDNGLLQAWEIFESVRMNADLVTLSACESGLGKEMGGEGLVGLTRAFEFAGARSVLASLWRVDDRATAELMKHFYGHLRRGLSKDEALRLAQTDLIRSRDWSAPRDWAGFQLDGDWR